MFPATTAGPHLAIASITVQGNTRVSSDSVIRESGIATGQNLFRCDTSGAECDTDANPNANSNARRAHCDADCSAKRSRIRRW